MQPVNAPSEPDKGQKHRLLSQVVDRLKDQDYLFVVAIAMILGGMASLASVRGTPDIRFITTVIAILAFFVIIVSSVVKLFQVKRQQDRQQDQINRLVTAMSPSVFRHLAGIYILKSYLYRQNCEAPDGKGKDKDDKDVVGDLFQRECYYLKHHGFIEPPTLEFDTRLHLQNLAERARPTELGLLCLQLRKKDILEIEDNGVKWIDIKDNLKLEAVKTLGLKVDPNDHRISA